MYNLLLHVTKSIEIPVIRNYNRFDLSLHVNAAQSIHSSYYIQRPAQIQFGVTDSNALSVACICDEYIVALIVKLNHVCDQLTKNLMNHQ